MLPRARWARLGRVVIRFVIAVLAFANFLGLAAKAAQVAHLGIVPAINTVGFDYDVLSQAAEAAVSGSNPYADPYFVWTPVGALVFYPLALLGWHVWQLLHVAAALAMPGRWLRWVVLLSFPFWNDMELGNIMVFVLLAGAWALRGNRIAVAAFLALTVLVPRPLMLPVALALVWKRSEWRVPFAVFVLAVVGISAATGLFPDLLIRLAETPARELGPQALNLAPTRYLGLWWMLAALPLAAACFCRARFGLASVLASPYWLSNYLLIGLLECDQAGLPRRVDQWQPTSGR